MTATRGRAVKARGVFASDDYPLTSETVVCLDTSFVVRALHRVEPQHAECLSFLQRIGDSSATVVFNELLRLELIESAYKLAVVERHGDKAWPRMRGDGRVRRGATRIASQLADSWEEALSALNHVELPVIATRDQLVGFMALGLSSYDSVHVATAVSEGATAIATTDYGFSRTPESVCAIVTTGDRVPAYRRGRARLNQR